MPGDQPNKKRRLNELKRPRDVRIRGTPNTRPKKTHRAGGSPFQMPQVPAVEPMNPANSPFPVGRLSAMSDSSDGTERYSPTYGRVSAEPPAPQTIQSFTPVRTQSLPGQTEGSFGVTDQLARVASRGLPSPPRLTNLPPANAHVVKGLRTFAEQGAGAAVREAARTTADALYTAGGTALGTSLGGIIAGPAGAAAGGAVGGHLGRAAGRHAEAALAGKVKEFAMSGSSGRAAASKHMQRMRRRKALTDRRVDPTKPERTVEDAPMVDASPSSPPPQGPAPVLSGTGPGPQAPFVSTLFQGNAAFMDDTAPSGVPVVAKPRRGTVRVSAFTPLVPRVKGIGRFAIDPNSGFPFAGVNKSAVRSMQRAMRTPGPQVVF